MRIRLVVALTTLATACNGLPQLLDELHENPSERSEREERERVAHAKKVRQEAERQENEAARRGARAQAITWHERAVTAARKDDCAEVTQIADEVRREDFTYHEEVLYPDPVLAPCLQPAGILTRDAQIAARAGDCSAAHDSARRIHELDSAYHQDVFLADVDIAACWRIPARTTDAETLRYANQARNAARRFDCRAAKLMAGKVKSRDAAYHAELVASSALEGCP